MASKKGTALFDRNYIDVPKLTQRYLRQLSSLERAFRKNRPKDGIPDTDWLNGFDKLTKLITALQREDRLIKASNKFEDLSNEQLIKELEPLLLAAGWKKPPTGGTK